MHVATGLNGATRLRPHIHPICHLSNRKAAGSPPSSQSGLTTWHIKATTLATPCSETTGLNHRLQGITNPQSAARHAGTHISHYASRRTAHALEQRGCAQMLPPPWAAKSSSSIAAMPEGRQRPVSRPQQPRIYAQHVARFEPQHHAGHMMKRTNCQCHCMHPSSSMHMLELRSQSGCKRSIGRGAGGEASGRI